MNKEIHYNRLKTAIKDHKLLIFQYSCTDIFKPPVRITTAFAIDYFTDEEWCVIGDDSEFKKKIIKFLESHKDYYFVFMNFNINYTFQNFDLAYNERKLRNLINRCVDLDAAFETYAEKKGYPYVQKIKGGFDTRYYFALLNDISINSDWIWGKYETSIKNYQKLKKSSRIKSKIMVRLIDMFKNNTLKVEHNDEYIKKSKEIMGLYGRCNIWKGEIKKILIGIAIFLAGVFLDFFKNWIFAKILA